MKKNLAIVVFVLLFAGLGYAREFFFVNLNNIMYMKYYSSTSTMPVPAVMHVFESASYSTLYYSKYIYTLLWALLFMMLSYFALKRFTGKPLLCRLLIYTYVVMLIVAGLAMAYGLIVSQRLQNDEYTLSRWLLGIAQSPIICLILLASEKLYNKSFQP